MKHLIVAAVLLTMPLTGCLVEEPAPSSNSANVTEGEAPDAHLVEVDGYTLRISEHADGDSVTVDVDGLRYEVPWDGLTLRCPCRSYRSSIFDITIKQLGDGPAVTVGSPRLGLVASVDPSADYPGQYATVVNRPGWSEPRKPMVGDWLELIDTMNDEELQLLNKIAETDLAAHLSQYETARHVDLFWADEAELAQIVDMLNARIYAPTR